MRSLWEFCSRCDPHSGHRRAERAKRYWEPAPGSAGISRAESVARSNREMNFGNLIKAYDAFLAFRDVTRRFREKLPAETGLAPNQTPSGLAGQIEARLTNVVVAALKQAFTRVRARLELAGMQVGVPRR